MQPKRRQKDRPRRSFFVPRPQPAQGLFRAPWRERFLCLRRPHFFQQRKKWGKERRQKLRFCTSSARYAQQRFPAYSRGQSPLLSLSVKRTACTFTGAEADAAACFSHGRRFSLLPPSPKAFPLDGSAVLNDRPVACQIREPTRRETGSPGGRTPVSLPLEGAPVLTLGCAQLKVSPKGADEV